MSYHIYFAADTYNADAYGSGTYQNNQTTGTGVDTAPTTTPLANTGYDIIVPAALGIAVLGASLLLLVKKLRTKSSK